MNELSLIVFAVLFGASAAAHLWQTREWTKERARLLDRIMARNYNEFVHSVTSTVAETPQMTSDEAEFSWHEKNKAAHPDQYPDEAA